MTGLLDTSVLVRYLTGDPAPQAEHAAALLDSGIPLAVPTVALVESAYVLTTLYGIGRADVVDALVDLVSRENLSAHELPTDRAIEALLLCRPSGRVSFADAMIWAAARSSPQQQVFTFDRRFPDKEIDRQILR